MMDHLVALVDAVDELWAWSAPCEANCCGVYGLCLDIPWWYCGDCTALNEKYRRKDASENGNLGKKYKNIVNNYCAACILDKQCVWLQDALDFYSVFFQFGHWPIPASQLSYHMTATINLIND